MGSDSRCNTTIASSKFFSGFTAPTTIQEPASALQLCEWRWSAWEGVYGLRARLVRELPSSWNFRSSLSSITAADGSVLRRNRARHDGVNHEQRWCILIVEDNQVDLDSKRRDFGCSRSRYRF